MTGPTFDEIQAMVKGQVRYRCGAKDGKGLPCELAAKHSGKPIHMRMAVFGEAPYAPGLGNSVVTWTEGPTVRRAK